MKNNIDIIKQQQPFAYQNLVDLLEKAGYQDFQEFFNDNYAIAIIVTD